MASFALPSSLASIQGAISVIGQLLGVQNNQPQVYIADTVSGATIWSQASIMGISVKPQAEVMQHPAENGTSFMDHRVIQPLEVTVRLIAEKAVYRDVYSSIVTYWQSGNLVDVYARTGVGRSMAMLSYPHEEDPDYFDAIPIEINLRQMLIINASQGTMTTSNTARPADTNTVQQGQQTPVLQGVNNNANIDALNAGVQGQGQ